MEEGRDRSLLRTLRIEWELDSEQSAEPAAESLRPPPALLTAEPLRTLRIEWELDSEALSRRQRYAYAL